MRLLKRMLIAGLGLVALGVGLLIASSRQSLDTEYRHTQRVEMLPPLASGSSDGRVAIAARGLSFRARVAGLEGDGPALVLLHGFPETSIMWEPLTRAAVSAGFRVVAFDQRGYSPLARPDAVEAYRLPELVADVLAVADAVGFDRFHLVGHDWGAIVGWAAAAQEPRRILSFASLSIPHPGAIRVANEGQDTPLYVKVFRAAGVAEVLFTARDLALMRTAFYATMPSDQVDEYVSVFSEPGALRAALNWYRAMPPEFVSSKGLVGEVVQPVLYVFGPRDIQSFTRQEVRDLQPQFATGELTQVEVDTGHFLIQERPKEVVDAVMSHLLALTSTDRSMR